MKKMIFNNELLSKVQSQEVLAYFQEDRVYLRKESNEEFTVQRAYEVEVYPETYAIHLQLDKTFIKSGIASPSSFSNHHEFFDWFQAK